MRGMMLKVNAKVNLSLNISGVRADGMHLLDMVLTSVNIADVITVFKKETGRTTVSYSGGESFLNDTVLKAMRLLESDFPHIKADIFIDKKIPARAGLGGSSADAAGVLFAIDKIFGLSEKGVKIAPTALQTGSDVPYLINGGFARVQSTGERIENFSASAPLNLVICNGEKGVDTAKAFKKFDELFPAKTYAPTDNDELISALKNGYLLDTAMQMSNALASASESLEPSIKDTLSALKQTPSLAVTMTGSGSACIGLYETAAAAALAQAHLKAQGLSAYAVQTPDKGIEVLEVFWE